MRNKSKYYKIQMLLLLLSAIGYAQQALTERDYEKWHTLATGPVSADGNWVAYSMHYTNGKDTLFLKRKDDKPLRIPGGHSSIISDNSEWFLYLVNDTLKVKGLKKQFAYDIPAVGSYVLRDNTLICRKDTTLSIHEIGSPSYAFINDVSEFALNAQGSRVAIVRDSAGVALLQVIETKKADRSHKVITDFTHKLYGITWNSSGNAFAFFGASGETDSKNVVIYRYSSQSGMPVAKISLPAALRNHSIANTSLHLSDNGNNVFFDLEAPYSLSTGADEVHILKHSDLTIPPMPKKRYFWHLWSVDTGNITALEDSEYQTALPIANDKYIVAYSHKKYLPLHNYSGYYMDMCLQDLKTGQRKLILEKQLYNYQHVLLSPSGKYIAYFKNKEWWIYSIDKDVHRKITGAVPNQFYDTENDYPHEAPYGIGGWGKDDTCILLYDKHDIWSADPNSAVMHRITKGKENNVVFRLYNNGLFPVIHSGFGFTSKMYDYNEGLFIVGLDQSNYGYELWYYTKKMGLRNIANGLASIKAITKAKKSDDIYFLESSFELPPQFVHIDAKGKKKIILQSNPQQSGFLWGTSKLILFNACGKKDMKAALFYPAGYDPKKKYPMIVNIYHDKSKELHQYVMPTLNVYDGFNTTNFTTSGYFVLMPDIHFIMDKPGASALECVLAASEAAIGKASVNRDRIALVGHSFGGFETSYIISKTNLFRAAISGSGISDLMNFYLDIDPFDKSNMERFDNGQYRNRLPFYTPGFSAESPLYNVTGINTPLLLWSGVDDKLVPPSNNIRLHSALWRLGKESTLLLYPKESHVIENPIHQADLHHKALDWLGFYLKDGPKPKWME